MRKPPPEVAPVVHQGIRWEAAALGDRPVMERPAQDPAPDGLDGVAIARALTAALVRELRGSSDLDPYQLEPDWVRRTLVQAGFSPPEVEWMVANTERTRDAILRYREAVREQGRGGVVSAWDQASNRRLFDILVYPDRDVFITALEIRDGKLLVRDQQRRVHRIDLENHQLIDSSFDVEPSEIDEVVAILVTLPGSYRDSLGEDVVRLKSALDQSMFSGFGLGMRDEEEMMAALSRLLGGLEPLAGRHLVLERAFQLGEAHLLRLQAGDPEAERCLYSWLQNELSCVVNELTD